MDCNSIATSNTSTQHMMPLLNKMEILNQLALGESAASVAKCYFIDESAVQLIKEDEHNIRCTAAMTWSGQLSNEGMSRFYSVNNSKKSPIKTEIVSSNDTTSRHIDLPPETQSKVATLSQKTILDKLVKRKSTKKNEVVSSKGTPSRSLDLNRRTQRKEPTVTEQIEKLDKLAKRFSSRKIQTVSYKSNPSRSLNLNTKRQRKETTVTKQIDNLDKLAKRLTTKKIHTVSSKVMPSRHIDSTSKSRRKVNTLVKSARRNSTKKVEVAPCKDTTSKLIELTPEAPKKVTTLAEKVDILDKLSEGSTITSVARSYGISKAKVKYYKKMKSKIRLSAANGDPSTSKRTRKVITLKEKIDLLDKLSDGQSIDSVAEFYGLNESSVRSMKKIEDKIRLFVSKGAPTNAKITFNHCPVKEKVEATMSTWIELQAVMKNTVNGNIVKKKALQLFKEISKTIRCSKRPFLASAGWLYSFKNRFPKVKEILNASIAKCNTSPKINLKQHKLVEFKECQQNGSPNCPNTILITEKIECKPEILDFDTNSEDILQVVLPSIQDNEISSSGKDISDKQDFCHKDISDNIIIKKENINDETPPSILVGINKILDGADHYIRNNCTTGEGLKLKQDIEHALIPYGDAYQQVKQNKMSITTVLNDNTISQLSKPLILVPNRVQTRKNRRPVKRWLSDQ